MKRFYETAFMGKVNSLFLSISSICPVFLVNSTKRAPRFRNFLRKFGIRRKSPCKTVTLMLLSFRKCVL